MANTLRAATQFCHPQVACTVSWQCNAMHNKPNQKIPAQQSIYRNSLGYCPEYRT